jgi:hypothetical protein
MPGTLLGEDSRAGAIDAGKVHGQARVVRVG